MDKNEITSLPNAPNNLTFETNISKLSVNHNKLKGLPENIHVIMKKLSHLSAENNRITSLPEGFGSIHPLTYLYIYPFFF